MATEVSFVPAEVNLTVYDGDSLNLRFNLTYADNITPWLIPTVNGGAGWKGDIRDSSTALTSLSSYQAANSTTIVYTSPTTHLLQVGDSVTITSSSVNSHNLTATITAVTSTTFSVSGTTTTTTLNGTGGQFAGKLLIPLTNLASSQTAGTNQPITYTSATTHSLQVGQSVTITSSTAATHNLTATINAVTPTTFMVPFTGTTTNTSGTGANGFIGTNSGTFTLTPSTSYVDAYLDPTSSALLKPGTTYNYDIQYQYINSSKTYLKTIVNGTITVESQATL